MVSNETLALTSPEAIVQARFQYYFNVFRSGLRGRIESAKNKIAFEFLTHEESPSRHLAVGFEIPDWRTKRTYSEALGIFVVPFSNLTCVKGIGLYEVRHNTETTAQGFVAVQEPKIGIGSAITRLTDLLLITYAERAHTRIRRTIEDQNILFLQEYCSLGNESDRTGAFQVLTNEHLRWGKLFDAANREYVPGHRDSIENRLNEYNMRPVENNELDEIFTAFSSSL